MNNLIKMDASAGAGKTYSLTKRFLKLLAHGSLESSAHCSASLKNGYNFSEILAVTFTNLAASQMQERVITELKKIALAKTTDNEDWTQENAINALNQIFRQFSALNIKTIDSLLHHLVRISALELELPPEFDVTFDNTKLIEPLFEQYVLQALQDESLARSVYDVCQSMISYKKTFRNFLMGDNFRDECIKIVHALICAENEKLQAGVSEISDDVLKALLSKIGADEGITSTKYMMEKLEALLFDEQTKAINSKVDFEKTFSMIDNQKTSFENLKTQDTLETAHSDFLNSFASKEEVDNVLLDCKVSMQRTAKKLAKCIHDDGLEASKNFTNLLSSLMVGEYKKSAYLEKEYFDECLNKGSKGTASCHACNLYSMLKEEALTFSRLDIIVRHAMQSLAILKLSSRIANQVWEEEKKQALILSSRMPFLVKEVLLNGDYVSGAFCRMGANLTHILLDEFQDTSNEQWKAMEPLARGALSLSGSVFFVGDRKQAIYGWRGGDAELFQSAPHSLTPVARGYEATQLSYNWRSESRIIEWNNTFFSQLISPTLVRSAMLFFEPHMTAGLCNDLEIMQIFDTSIEKVNTVFKSVYQRVSPEKRAIPREGLVQVHHINVPKKKTTLASLALLPSCVHSLKSRYEWHEICVLTVTNAQASLVAEALLAEGIPVVSQGSLLMAEHPIIKELVALLRFLSNPMDDQAFWTVLASKHILPLHFYTRSLHDFLATKRKGSLFRAFREKFSDVWEILFKPLLDGAGLMTAYDTLCEIYKRFDIRARHTDADIFLLRFLEIAHLAEGNAHMDLAAFLGWWDINSHEEKAPLPQNAGAVSVMTVHKAKGLEFNAVIIPWHNFNVQPDQSIPQIIEYSYKGMKLRLFSKLVKEHGAPYYKALFDKVLECINALYVAWTRPVKELHVFLPTEPASKNEAFPKFLEAVLHNLLYGVEFVRENKIENLENSKESSDYIKREELLENEDYISYGKKQLTCDSSDKESIIKPINLRLLEYWLCQNEESFAPTFLSAKNFVETRLRNIPHFDEIDTELIEEIKSTDILYYAKKIACVFREIEKKAEGVFPPKEQTQNKVQENRIPCKSKKEICAQNSLLPLAFEHWDDVQSEDLCSKKDIMALSRFITSDVFIENENGKEVSSWERPMAWLPRIKVFRNNLQDLEKVKLTPNKRGTLMHKCLETIVYSGNVQKDVERAINAVLGVKVQNTSMLGSKYTYQDIDRQEFEKSLTWFLERTEPYGGAREWLRYGLKEHALSSAEGNMFRVDLLVNRPASIRMEGDDIALLAIDYKTGYKNELPEKENVLQIQNYLSLLKDSTTEDTKVLGLLIYLDRGIICPILLDK